MSRLITHGQLGLTQYQVRKAFTLVECIVVLGVTLVLISFALPSLGRARKQAEVLKKKVAVQQNSLALAIYASDHREYFPRAFANAQQAALYWYIPMVSGGYIPNQEASDPVGFSRFGFSTISLSQCVVCDPKSMRVGFTTPIPETKSSWVRMSQVSYPSHKGIMLELTREWASQNPVRFCCTPPLLTVPVAFADGSIFEGTRLTFNQGQEPFLIDGIGLPVFSSWGGYLAFDR
jgi:prepilin-type N-terminal cleavage/methylation domain-containing protein